MKKITLLTALVALGSFAIAQTKLAATNKTAMERIATLSSDHKYNGRQITHAPLSGAKKAVGDTIWSEDFTGGMPTGWTVVDNTGNGFDWVINDQPLTADFTGTGIISSTSSGNHMLLFGDQYNGGGGAQNMDAYFQTDAIDLTGIGSVEVEFQQKFRVCCAGGHQLSLFVSNDNTNWTEFDVRGGVAINIQSADPDLVTVDITCIASNQATVYLRWHKIGASHYYWMVDDILIREVPLSYDVSIEENFFLDPWLTPPYSRIPAAQIDTSVYAGVIKTNRLGMETGVTFNVTVNDGTNDVYNESSAPVTINGCIDSTYIALPNGWLTNNLGVYSIDMEVTSDSTDNDPSNNTVMHSIEVTDTVFARDNSAPVFELHAAAYAVTQPYEFGVWYEVANADMATSISVQLGPGTVVGTVIQGKVYADDLTTVLESTAFYTVVNGDPGNWVTLALAAPLALAAQSNLLVNVAEFGGNDTAMTIQATNAIDQPFATSWLFYGGGTTTPIVEVPFIRLNVGPPAQVCNLAASAPAMTAVSCNGNSDGAVSGIVLSGGTAPYSYLWAPGGQTQADISLLAVGVYTLTVTDSAGCMYSLAATVTQPDVLVADPTVTDITCNGSGDGIVNGDANGGNLVGTPGVIHFSENFQGVTTPNLPTGFTTATVGTDAGFITGDATIANTGGFWPVPAHGIFAQTNDDVCNCDKSADYLTLPVIDFTGLAGLELNFAAYDDGAFGQAPTDVELSVNAGAWTTIYSMTPDSLWQNITVPLPVSTDNQPSVQFRFHYNDAGQWASGFAVDDISVETPAVLSAYLYSFNGSAYSTASNFTGVAAGSYTFKVMDASGCEDSTIVTIVEPAALAVTFTSTLAICGVGGSASATVTGGLAPFVYLWDDPAAQDSSTAMGLLPGLYTVSITDANGCTGTVADSVTGTDPVTIDTSTVDPSSCGLSDGSATATVVTGTAPFNYSWDPAAQGTATATGLPAGIYNVTVTDIFLCTSTATLQLFDIGAPTLQIDSTKDVSCMGGTDGDASVLGFLGTPPFSYLWNDPSAQTTAQATGLGAGTYMVVVTDAANCSSLISATISEPSTALVIDSATATSITCFGDGNGTATVASTGGTGAPSYSWSPGGSTNQSLSSQGPGTYTVVVTDANGCTATDSAIVLEPALLVVATAVPTDVSCFGFADGSIDATVTGGTAPYNYLWNDPGASTDEDPTDLGPANYNLVVTDANGCSATGGAPIGGPSLALTTSITSFNNETVVGADDGTIAAAATGGTSPYSPFWSGPNLFTSTDLIINGLPNGSYVLTLTDANGCIATSLTQEILEGTGTGVLEMSNDVVFKIYPNPNTGQFIVELNNLKNDEYLIEIRNIIGQLVFTENISKLNGNFYKKVDLTTKENGVYFISLTNDEGKTTKKLIVY